MPCHHGSLGCICLFKQLHLPCKLILLGSSSELLLTVTANIEEQQVGTLQTASYIAHLPGIFRIEFPLIAVCKGMHPSQDAAQARSRAEG